nr:unnamed protein product [Callosobruchus analis]
MKFRLLNHLKVPTFLQPNDFLVKLDLSQAYFHVPIKPHHRRFLSILYKDQILQWTCPPFGLASASLAFSRLSNWVASRLREMGIRIIVYLDDFLLTYQDPVILKGQAEKAIAFLMNLGKTQQHSGLFIPGQAFSRLEAIKEIGSPNFSKVGHSRDRPLCIEAFQDSEIICLERHDGSRSRFYGCVQSSLEFQSCLDFPTASLDPQSPLPPQLRSGDLHFGGAMMREGLLETRSEEQSHSSSHPDSQCKSPPVGKPDGQASPAISQNIFGGMENTWWASTTKNWPEEVRSLLERAWRRSTLKTYSSPWKQWLAWCARIKSNPVQPEVGVLAQYLTFLFRVKRFAPASIRVYESVIVSLVVLVRGEALAASSLVRHMVKAIVVSYSSSMGPAKVIWDVSLLISWLKTEALDETSLYQVSRRLSLLLLLASGRRIHDLTLLRMDNEHMTRGDGYVCFWPTFGSKTDRDSHRQSG